MSAHTEALKLARETLLSLHTLVGDDDAADSTLVAAEHLFVATLNTIDAALSLPDPGAAPVVPQWLPIESAPRDGSDVLLTATVGSMIYPHPRVVVGCWNRGWWLSGAIGGCSLSHVKAWMPAPQQGEQG